MANIFNQEDYNNCWWSCTISLFKENNITGKREYYEHWDAYKILNKKGSCPYYNIGRGITKKEYFFGLFEYWLRDPLEKTPMNIADVSCKGSKKKCIKCCHFAPAAYFIKNTASVF